MAKNTDRLLLLETLRRVAQRQSLSAAAEDMGVSNATISRHIQELEDRLEIHLLRRNTHAVSLTPAGLSLLPDASQILDNWDHISQKHSPEQAVEVALKVVAPVGLGQSVLVKLMADFLLENPNITIAWHLITGNINFYEQGCDLWIGLGPPSDESLITKQVGKISSTIAASPEYEHFGIRQHPSELKHLPNVAYESSSFSKRLDLQHINGEQYSMTPPSRFITGNFPAFHRATLLGLGYAALPYWYIEEDLKNGTLVEILPEWILHEIPISLSYAPSRYQSPVILDLATYLLERIPEIGGIKR